MGDSKSTQSRSHKLKVPRHVRNKRKTQSAFDNLTEELLCEILIRLPYSKEAIRCKLVCKRWFSLISSRYFVTSFIDRRHNTNPPFTLVFHNEQHAEYVEFHSVQGLSKHVDLGFLSASRIKSEICLEASCGDLILCSVMSNYMKSSSTMNYYICNIVTRQWIALPPAPSGRGNFGENVDFLIEPNSKDNHQYMYLVLRFIPCGYSEFRIEKFSSEQGKWTELVVTSSRILNCWCSTHKISLIACEKMLFTMVHETSIIVDCILAFDPFNDPARFLRIIDLPLEARHIGGVCKLGVCQGRLRFSQIIFLQASPSRYPSISIWELEDYRTGKWCLVYKKILTNTALRCPLLGYDSKDMDPEICVLAFHPYNENLLYFLVGYSVVAYNIRTEKVESSSWPSLLIKLQRSTRQLTTYYGSNVLPLTQNWWPTPVLRQPFNLKTSYQRVSCFL